jgi:hypothetical protein
MNTIDLKQTLDKEDIRTTSYSVLKELLVSFTFESINMSPILAGGPLDILPIFTCGSVCESLMIIRSMKLFSLLVPGK